MRGRRRGWTGVRGTRPGAKASLPSSAVRLWPHKRSYFSAQRNGTTNAHGERERAWGWRKGILQDVVWLARCRTVGRYPAPTWHTRARPQCLAPLLGSTDSSDRLMAREWCTAGTQSRARSSALRALRKGTLSMVATRVIWWVKATTSAATGRRSASYS